MKKVKIPCEYAIWYLVPAIRKELVKILVEDFLLSQKEAAAKLNLTEAAVSQYLRERRGLKVKLDNLVLKEIKKAAKEISESKEPFSTSEKICSLCLLARTRRQNYNK